MHSSCWVIRHHNMASSAMTYERFAPGVEDGRAAEAEGKHKLCANIIRCLHLEGDYMTSVSLGLRHQLLQLRPHCQPVCEHSLLKDVTTPALKPDDFSSGDV